MYRYPSREVNGTVDLSHRPNRFNDTGRARDAVGIEHYQRPGRFIQGEIDIPPDPFAARERQRVDHDDQLVGRATIVHVQCAGEQPRTVIKQLGSGLLDS